MATQINAINLDRSMIRHDKNKVWRAFQVFEAMKRWHKMRLAPREKRKNGMTEKNGIPHIWEVPCIKEVDYRLHAEKFNLSQGWLCPHCLTFITTTKAEPSCSKGCHLRRDLFVKSFFNVKRR